MIRAKFLFAWYDLWVGLYYDRKAKKLYFFPVPMLGVCFYWKEEESPKLPIRSMLDMAWGDDDGDYGAAASFHEERGDI